MRLRILTSCKNRVKTLYKQEEGRKRLKDKESKRGGLPQPLPKGKGFVAALMHRTWESFLETKSQRDKGTKGRREEESKSQRVKEIKRKRGKDKPRKTLEEYGGCAAAVMLPFWSYKSKLLTPNRQHPPCLLSEGCHSLQGDKQK